MTAKCIDRGTANVQIFTRGVVFCDVLDSGFPKTTLEREFASTSLAGRLFAATLLGKCGLATSFGFAPTLGVDSAGLGFISRVLPIACVLFFLPAQLFRG